MGAVKELLLILGDLEHFAADAAWVPGTPPEGMRRRVFVDAGGRPIGEALYEDDQLVAARWLVEPPALPGPYG